MNKHLSSLLVFIFVVINITCAVDTTPTSMQCYWDGDWKNEMDGYLSSRQSTYFLSGMYSHHDPIGTADRRFRFRWCKPIALPSSFSSIALPETNWDATWTKSCKYINQGNDAVSGIESWHDNHYEDRKYRIYCGSLDTTEYTLENCVWNNGYINEYTKTFSYQCPDNKVIRSIKSTHSNTYEDRLFRFECCQIMEPDTTVSYTFGDITGKWVLKDANFNGGIEYTVTIGTSSTVTNSITEEYSEALSLTVGMGFEFGGVSGNVEVTGEVAQSMSDTIENSFETYIEETISKSCDEGILYQWVMSGSEIRSDDINGQFTFQSKITLCTDVPNPKCPPFGAVDEDYQECIDDYDDGDDDEEEEECCKYIPYRGKVCSKYLCF